MKIILLILTKKILNRLSKLFKFISPNSVIEKFIKKDFSEIIEKYKNFSEESISSEKFSENNGNIWIFWWQGYDTAPFLVKKCIDSIIKNAGNHPVVLITKENWKNYADIPDHIIAKMKKGIITLTHFSDILRMVLISKHGGLWLDATIFVSREIPEYCFELPYFSIHYETSTSKIAKGKWTGFCQAGRKNLIIHSFCLDIFFSYWEKNNKLIDYFFIDYVMLAGYNNISDFKKLVDAVPPNNQGIKELDKHFNDEYSKELLDNILSESTFFKLNWKRDYKKVTNGKKTLYGYFLEN
ncbi:capsular polysaccharide synthesis protein [uncultured Treponema sp.]|uniref:capsular polysaccharide synthesis protein n=1 Tax=uncultured Treponema sp. TaxID=162155 RepID=UPI002597E01C|nr:capsular polysaccharide synthesis protein [uncultured Treponema sp.]